MISSGCAHNLRPMPKITRCITKVDEGIALCQNSYGTRFEIKFDSPDFNKMICAPGSQVIDWTAWLKELLITIQAGTK